MIPANVISVPRPQPTGQLPGTNEPAPRPAAEQKAPQLPPEPTPAASSVTTVPTAVVLPLDENAADSPALEVARAAYTWSARVGGSSGDINSQVQWVLRDSYLESTRDLYFFANKVRFFNDVKGAIRDELARANGALAETAGEPEDFRLQPPFTTRPIDDTYCGEPFVPPPPVDEVAPPPALPPVFQAVLDGMKALLPLVIEEAFEKKYPNGDLGLGAEVIDTVLDLIAGIESGDPEEVVRAIAEGIYDSLEILLPVAVARYFPAAAAIPGLPEMITQIILGFVPDPSEQQDDDPDTVETKAELEAHIEKLEEQFNSVGDDAQLANVDLQNMLQKQQQTIQMMSNIAKMLHDTTMAVVRKIGS